ncbi:glycosyl hydrolases 31 family protein [Collimonas arenae]|uniref:Glycosyl hydrolases 31 family protein n=1 Tax=Collimonas arenae TaxID=279058 RepID=A0A127QFW1_9BURK|nr:glycoside hydrolase family 31 protein [Collimonas arenae]AMP08512.1 glycosyl hydrolases 31 family protein [Collimonas arenae]
MSVNHIPAFHLAEKNGATLTLKSEEGHVAHIFVLEQDIIRVMVLPDAQLHFPRTWAIAPGTQQLPLEGRERLSLAGFSLPDYTLRNLSGALQIQTEKIRLTVQLKGLFCAWETRPVDEWKELARDRSTQAVNFGYWDDKVYHYLKRDAQDEMYFGLGERSGDTNRHGRSYSLKTIDAMGYNASSTDALYKHIPFYVTWSKRQQAAFGLFYDTLSEGKLDMGCELDNYHGHYRYFVAEHGDLDYYFIAGDSMEQVVRRYTWMTGKPAFTPRWGLGYSGSTMTYTDEPNAQEKMNEFLANCEQHDMLCESFHLSSGYTSIGSKRYVFNWNRDKFPDPKAFAQHYLDHGIRLCANIKPCLLQDHPRFSEAESLNLFIKNQDGKPEMVQFWDEVGAYLDFTNPDTIVWWKRAVTTSLLEYGITSTWNDNNEFQVLNPQATANGFGQRFKAVEAKGLQTLLMMAASQEAQTEFTPEKRPYLVSRSGAAGMQRYVQTWSGDNYTSWQTLKYNIKMGLGLAMSGISNTGHDVGGFSGPAPSPELLLRWVQFGIFMPRFSIHSWNDDKTVNEAWMYPEITGAIRNLLKLRACLTPYFYDLLWRYHQHYEPMIRPTFLAFPNDPKCFVENDDMLVGTSLLLAAVVEPNQTSRNVYLPAGADWYDFWSGAHHRGGQEIVLPAVGEQPPLLARAGSAIAINVAEQHFNQAAHQQGFMVFPHQQDGAFETEFFDDDGDSNAYLDGKSSMWKIQVQSNAETLDIDLECTGIQPASDLVTLLLPQHETRQVVLSVAAILGDAIVNQRREIQLKIKLQADPKPSIKQKIVSILKRFNQ